MNDIHKLCVCFRDKNLAEWLKKNQKICFAEARLDLMNPTISEVKDIISLPLTWIATCHKGVQDDNQRLNLLKTAIENGASYVDVDCNESISFINSIQKLAKKHSCKIILSYHNYLETPSFNQISEIVKDCQLKGCDYVKIALFIQTSKDINIIKKLYSTFNKLIVIGMGKEGKEFRLKILEWGAPFTYIAIDSKHQTAEGQLTFDEVNNFFI